METLFVLNSLLSKVSVTTVSAEFYVISPVMRYHHGEVSTAFLSISKEIYVLVTILKIGMI